MTADRAERLLRTAELFLYLEARLLDEKRWREWLDLFTADGEYWIPLRPDQSDPHYEMSIMYEDRTAMELRVRRFDHPAAHSLKAPWYSAHSVSNVLWLDGPPADDRAVLEVRSNFNVLEARGDRRTHYGGFCEHRLAPQADGALAIARKKVVLADAEAPLGNLQIYL